MQLNTAHPLYLRLDEIPLSMTVRKVWDSVVGVTLGKASLNTGNFFKHYTEDTPFPVLVHIHASPYKQGNYKLVGLAASFDGGGMGECHDKVQEVELGTFDAKTTKKIIEGFGKDRIVAPGAEIPADSTLGYRQPRIEGQKDVKWIDYLAHKM